MGSLKMGSYLPAHAASIAGIQSEQAGNNSPAEPLTGNQLREQQKE